MRESKRQPNPQLDTERTKRAIRRRLNPKLSDAQRHHLRLLTQLGVNRHIPRHTAAALVRLGLIAWDGPTSSGDGMQAGGYMLTDAGRAALGVGIPQPGQEKDHG